MHLQWILNAFTINFECLCNEYWMRLMYSEWSCNEFWIRLMYSEWICNEFWIRLMYSEWSCNEFWIRLQELLNALTIKIEFICIDF